MSTEEIKKAYKEEQESAAEARRREQESADETHGLEEQKQKAALRKLLVPLLIGSFCVWIIFIGVLVVLDMFGYGVLSWRTAIPLSTINLVYALLLGQLFVYAFSAAKK